MSLLVRQSPFVSRSDRRRTERLRVGHRFRLGIELLEDRVTPTTTVTGLSPTFGPTAGGTLVTISGTGFTGVTAVNFGTIPATSETVVSPTSITAQSPAGVGTVDVTVTATGGTSPITPADEFTYAPTVTGLSPTSGPASGGTSVTIIGTGLTGATAVHFGTASATNIHVVSANSLTAVSPAGSGVVDVTVTTPAGTSTVSPADQFTYPNVPVVTAISPTSGPAVGGTLVTITGTGFTGATAVDFGTNAATDVTAVSDTEVTAVSPAGSGTVDVTVIAPGGTSAASMADQFTYGPAVTSISPKSGPQTGGTVVVITGTSLANATVVDFGTTPSSDILSDSATQIVAVSPAGTAGQVDVTVTTPLGTSATSANDTFIYTNPAQPAPTVTGLSPSGGPPSGGTLVTITGTGFVVSQPTLVNFGTASATSVDVVNTTTITAISPAGAGVVDVTVANLGGTSSTSSVDQFSYVPTVTSVSPRSGPVAGGTEVVITGVNLGDVSAVDFGTAPATTLISDSATQVVVLSPPGFVFGTVDVTVSTQGGTSATSSADQFSYTAPGAVAPRVTGLSPSVGSPTGGNIVTITGTGFDENAQTSVFFGSTPATDVTVLSSTKITAVSPAGAGAVSVTVVTLGGTSFPSPTAPPTTADQFTYITDGPTVTAVERFGYHAQPTFIVIVFNGPLETASAQAVSNYHIVGPARQRIRVKSAKYNPTTDTVTLALGQRLPLSSTYSFTINGTPASGLQNPDGLFLDGAYTGEPGSNYVTSITRSNLAGSATQRPVAAAVRAKARSLVLHAKAAIHKHVR